MTRSIDLPYQNKFVMKCTVYSPLGTCSNYFLSFTFATSNRKFPDNFCSSLLSGSTRTSNDPTASAGSLVATANTSIGSDWPL